MKFNLAKTFTSISGTALSFLPDTSTVAKADTLKAAIVVAIEADPVENGVQRALKASEGAQRNRLWLKITTATDDEIDLEAEEVAFLKELLCASLRPVAVLPLLTYLESGKAE